MSTPRSKTLVLSLALCLGISLFAAPPADAMITREIRAIEAIVRNLLSGAKGDLKRVQRFVNRGIDVVEDLLGGDSDNAIADFSKERRAFEREYKRQMNEAEKLSDVNAADLSRKYEKQISNAEETFREQQRKAERQAERAEKTAERAQQQTREFRNRTAPDYDSDAMQREIQAQMRAYDRELAKLKRQQEKALREYQRGRRR